MDDERNNIEESDSFTNNISSTLYVKKKHENREIDYEWLDLFEEVLPYIEVILKNPKRFIINEEEIVKIEQSKKVTVESVIHLTQHTSFIQKVEDNGDVKPAKILNINHEESLDTYENRFLYTLLNNIRIFYDQRVNGEIGRSYVLDKNDISYSAKSYLDNEQVRITLNLEDDFKVLKDTGNKNGISLNDRLANVKKYLDGFYSSELYTSLERLKVAPVRSPIRHTNVILKNPNYQKAEQLWNYIQSYVSKDSLERDNRDYYDNGQTKREYDKAFLMTFLANRNLINSSSASESNLVRQMMNNLIDNLLDSDESLNEDKIKEFFINEIDKTKRDNKSKGKSIKDIFHNRLERELAGLEDAFDCLEGEFIENS